MPAVKTRMDMLAPLYGNFDKTVYAGFAVKVAEGAQQGDALCRRAFEKVGIAEFGSVTLPAQPLAALALQCCLLPARGQYPHKATS